jgi:hypothetical protein
MVQPSWSVVQSMSSWYQQRDRVSSREAEGSKCIDDALEVRKGVEARVANRKESLTMIRPGTC